MNYLALHIDTDFLVGTICADEGNFFYPIINGNDECFWLYFYNDPYSGNISFGKDNQRHCNKGETNYIGNFIELIENENNTFQVGAYEYPIIELLRYSKILDILKTNFITQTYESQENIPTLLTFSLSIKDLAKKTIVDFLKKQGFDIISYTIPLSELACKYSIMNNRINFANGNIVTFLEATNTNLHLVKLIFTTDYFLSDGDSESNQGLGIDPRRRAILKFVVNKIGTMGHLSSEQKEIEYKLLEPKTIDWLNDLDMQTNNAPFPIIESLSKMPNHKKRVLVYKDKLSEFTQSDIKLIVDTYKDFVNRNISQDVSSIVLLGSLFQNEIIQNKFQSLIPNDRLFVYSNRDIQNILSIYPKIDFNRYTSEQGRIEAKAIADKQRKAEELAKEIAKAKVEKDAKDKAEAEAKKDIEKQKGRILYDQALALEKEERLEEALLNIKDAILLDPERIEYSRFRDHLNVKTKELNVKTEKYKSWYKDAECYEQSGELDLALKAYKNAQEIFDLAELRKKIVKLERDIEKQQVLIVQLVSEASTLVQNKKFDTAKDKIDAILAIDSSNAEAQKLQTKIDETLQEIENHYKALIKEADISLRELRFEPAIKKYYEALRIKPNDDYCLGQLKVVADKKESLKPPPPPPGKATKTDNTGLTPPPPIPTKDKPLSNGLPYKTGVPPPPPSIAPKSVNNGKIPPPPPPVPQKK